MNKFFGWPLTTWHFPLKKIFFEYFEFKGQTSFKSDHYCIFTHTHTFIKDIVWCLIIDIYKVSVFLEIQIWENHMNSLQSEEAISSQTNLVKEIEDDKLPFCRICHESGGKFIVVWSFNEAILLLLLLLIFFFVAEKQSQLISPCGCKGSMKHVHRACLQKWINMTQRSMV